MSELDRLRGAVLSTVGEKVIYEATCGIADSATGEAITAGTRFQVASVSKQFTAAAVLLLAERGVLSVHDRIRRWLPAFPPAWDAVTLHHLLTHSSGLGHWGDFPEIDLCARMDPQDELETFGRVPLRSSPGAAWYYSSPGYVLLAHVTQRAADRSYASFLAEEIFGPLGMTATFAGNSTGREQVARGHLRGESVDSFDLDVVSMGAGDVWSTVSDLARWDAAVVSGGLLSPTSRQTMLEVHVTVNDESFAPGHGYGYAWFAGDVLGRKMLFHPGDNAGFGAFNAIVPAEDRKLVVLSNEETVDVARIVRELL